MTTIEDPNVRMAEVQESLTLIDAALVAKRQARKELNAEIKSLVALRETNQRVLNAYERALKATGLQSPLPLDAATTEGE